MSNKYLNIGNIVVPKNNPDYLNLQISNVNLKELVELLQKHGSENLKGLTKDEIMEKEKAYEIPRLIVPLFKPHENAPVFIKYNLALKIDRD